MFYLIVEPHSFPLLLNILGKTKRRGKKKSIHEKVGKLIH